MTDRPWYKRYPSDALNGMVGLTLEQKGAYNVVLDLIYDRDGPIPDEERWLAGHCGCSVRKWKSIRDTLLALGKIELIDGLIDQKRARKERENARKTREKLAENGSKGGRKRAENADEALKTNDNFEAGLKHRARDQKLEARSQKLEKKNGSPDGAPDFVADFWSRRPKAEAAGIRSSLMGLMLKRMDVCEAIDALDHAMTLKDPPRYVGGILKSRNPSRKQSDLPPAIKAFADDGEPVQPLGNNRWKVGWDVMNERGEVVRF